MTRYAARMDGRVLVASVGWCARGCHLVATTLRTESGAPQSDDASREFAVRVWEERST